MSQISYMNTNMKHTHTHTHTLSHTLREITVSTQCEPSLKVDWRTKAVMVMTPETFGGQQSHRVGGRGLYLPGECSPLWSPRGARQPSSVYISGPVNWRRVVTHLADNCSQQQVDWTCRRGLDGGRQAGREGLAANQEGGAADDF